MHDEGSPPQTRLNAADGIIRNALKMGETLDVERRIDELEKAVVEMELGGRAETSGADGRTSAGAVHHYGYTGG